MQSTGFNVTNRERDQLQMGITANGTKCEWDEMQITLSEVRGHILYLLYSNETISKYIIYIFFLFVPPLTTTHLRNTLYIIKNSD